MKGSKDAHLRGGAGEGALAGLALQSQNKIHYPGAGSREIHA